NGAVLHRPLARLAAARLPARERLTVEEQEPPMPLFAARQLVISERPVGPQGGDRKQKGWQAGEADTSDSQCLQVWLSRVAGAVPLRGRALILSLTPRQGDDFSSFTGGATLPTRTRAGRCRRAAYTGGTTVVRTASPARRRSG